MIPLPPLWLVRSAALADPVSSTICAEYNVQYQDATSQLEELDDDYVTDNTVNQPARGARLKLHDNTVGGDTYVSLSWNQATACVQIQLDDNHNYNVQLLSYANVNGNWIYVRDSDCIGDSLPCFNVFAHQFNTSWTPIANPGTLNVPLDDHWNVAAVAAHAMYRRNAGVTGENIQFIMEQCTEGDWSCYDQDDNNYVYIADQHYHRKYSIVHELGHYLSGARIGFSTFAAEYEDPTEAHPCDGGLVDKNYASAAAVEGIAHYYAAVAFNSTAESDCEMAGEGDYTGDNLVTQADHEHSPSCAGASYEDWVEEDFLGTYCGTPHAEHGTMLDWTRAFWDADNVEGLTTTEVFDIFAVAGPGTWNETDAGFSSNNPKVRMEAAAVGLFLDTEWNAVDDLNGLR